MGDVPTIRTFTRRIVRPFDLRVDDIDLEDIAHHLSKQCRFGGAIAGDDTIYSVAEHACRVSVEVERECKRFVDRGEMTMSDAQELAFWGLHHDDDEAYLPDLPGPIKHAPEMAFYREAGKRAMGVICKALDLAPVEPALVKLADRRMCETEQRDIRRRPVDFGAGPNEGRVEPFEGRIVPWSPATAKRRFLDRHVILLHASAHLEGRK